MTRWPSLAAVTAALAIAAIAEAQPLGTFRWQLQPYCNVLTVAVTQTAGVYRIEGTDDQCGGGRDFASVQGLAFSNPDGTIGFGLTIVTNPGGAPVHVDAAISLAGLSGTWRDSSSGAGAFTFTPGPPTPGSPRPAPGAVVPPSISLRGDGGLVAVQNGAGTIPASGAGTRMMWYPGKAAFRAGNVAGDQWDDAQVGSGSVALGIDSRASAFASTALGHGTAAIGPASTALGRDTTASGTVSFAAGRNAAARNFAAVALGDSVTASGPYSLAVGQGTAASGTWSIAGGVNSVAGGNMSLAFGNHVSASGMGSVALGSRAVSTIAAEGSFVFADQSSENSFASFAPNEFVVRAAGGVGFYTDAATTSGAEMAPGGGSWAALSDANMKENFREVSGEEVLAKLAAIPIREWNYTSQDPAIRHLGPTAQDFRAAFGLGDFPLRINTTDADGVALAGVQALEARTRATDQRLARESGELAALREEVAALRRELEAIRATGRQR